MRKVAVSILVIVIVVISGCLGNHSQNAGTALPTHSGSNPPETSPAGTTTVAPTAPPERQDTSDHALLASLYPELEKELEQNRIISSLRPDAGYTVRVFAGMARERPLTPAEVEVLRATLRANNCYFSTHSPPEKSYHVISFSKERPLESVPYIGCSNFTSMLPFVYYKGRGFQYYPVTASNWAYHYLKTGQVKRAEALLSEMLPLMDEVNTSQGKAGVFRVYFSPPEGSPVPWTSSFSQGMLAGLYAWLYNETGNETYLNASRLLFNSFYIPLRDGGFLRETEYGTWFLEYPYRPGFLVLNGHIITMKGLWLYYRFTGDERALELFNEGLESVKKALRDCDTGEWSLYSVNGPEAREDYHRLHIRLLVWLYARTGDGIFLEYAEKWNGYLEKKGLKKENINALLQQVRYAP
ncbi:D-glucuronyl C5-epimerase family protein [Thermococcus sp. M36]|uniref:D-glucuronyl C5-epimerase family protein n=1 Tax=Thermococcus sp. M36 TaxID=1638261 RepID=UPI001F0E76E3|nr:D-glucuronyl C5-epimerase family protein [Thermococcus sp. M36]